MKYCMTCKWCEPAPTPMLVGHNSPGAQGICRFGPPSPGIVMTPQGPTNMTAWPLVTIGKDYCSHYEVQLVKEAGREIPFVKGGDN